MEHFASIILTILVMYKVYFEADKLLKKFIRKYNVIHQNLARISRQLNMIQRNSILISKAHDESLMEQVHSTRLFQSFLSDSPNSPMCFQQPCNGCAVNTAYHSVGGMKNANVAVSNAAVAAAAVTTTAVTTTAADCVYTATAVTSSDAALSIAQYTVAETRLVDSLPKIINSATLSSENNESYDNYASENIFEP